MQRSKFLFYLFCLFVSKKVQEMHNRNLVNRKKGKKIKINKVSIRKIIWQCLQNLLWLTNSLPLTDILWWFNSLPNFCENMKRDGLNKITFFQTPNLSTRCKDSSKRNTLMQNEVILDPVQGNEPSMISNIRLHLQNILYQQY